MRLTPPTLAKRGLGENASQNVFERIVMDAIINRWTLRDEILKLGRRVQIWSMEWSMRSKTERWRSVVSWCKHVLIESHLDTDVFGDSTQIVQHGYRRSGTGVESGESFTVEDPKSGQYVSCKHRGLLTEKGESGRCG